MRVLITGAGGYIGSVLTRHLLNCGYEVTALDRFFFGAKPLQDVAGNPKLKILRRVIRDMTVDDLRDVDAICDLAALSNDPSGDLDPALTLSINFEARKRLGVLASTAGVERYILASSCSVYGSTGGAIVDEDAPTKPLSTYATCNAEAEKALLALPEGGPAVTVLRNATVFGLSPRMRFDLVVNVMTLHAFQRGRILIMGGGRQWRPLVHVIDVARTIHAVLEAPLKTVRGKAFNCGLENFQIRAIGYLVREALPFRVEVEIAPDDDDKRDYRVSFARLSEIIDPATFRKVPDGIKEIYAALKSGDAEDDPTTRTVSWYRTILQAKSLVDEIMLDGRLL